ncbi:hypothetical protein CBR_g52626 [Chara braunii]|uniref:Uncharacterized protein n=1 Tax=Chara braunii TaxID=69332 RepID=A0A388MAK7_CHABU|nr:hypothetical protein CBR_g52626 [Chara braunii]|eukprot:GBG91590.1 hypothetical protein CBR_g52626 [Chara braunii]
MKKECKRQEREDARREIEEAKRREEEHRREVEARQAKKLERTKKREEEQLAMTKALEVQMAIRLSQIHDDIKNEVRKAIAKGKEKVAEEVPETSGGGVGEPSVEVITDETGKLSIAEKRKRGEDVAVGDSPPVATPTK